MLKFDADVGYVNTMDARTAAGKQQRIVRRASAGSVCATMPGRDSRFGTMVMKEMAERSVGGEVDLRYPLSGLTWRLTCPAANALETERM